MLTTKFLLFLLSLSVFTSNVRGLDGALADILAGTQWLILPEFFLRARLTAGALACAAEPWLWAYWI